MNSVHASTAIVKPDWSVWMPPYLRECKMWLMGDLSGYVAGTPKHPCGCGEGGIVKAHKDPQLWMDFETVTRAAKQYHGGIGVYLHADDPLVCLDLDGVLRDSPDLPPEKQVQIKEAFDEVLKLFEGRTFIETSYSGKGKHIFFLAPGLTVTRKLAFAPKRQIEVYTQDRFILCGNENNGLDVTDCSDLQDKLLGILDHYNVLGYKLTVTSDASGDFEALDDGPLWEIQKIIDADLAASSAVPGEKYGSGLCHEADLFYKWNFETCPNCECGEGDRPRLVLRRDGTARYQCFHASCAEFRLKQFAEKVGITADRPWVASPELFAETIANPPEIEAPNTEAAAAAQAPQSGKRSKKPAKQSVKFRRIEKVQQRKPEWVWEEHIPAGAITLIDGDPGLGKSQFLCDLAARMTCGLPMPDGTACGLQGDVVFLTSEDAPEPTLKPRLNVAGADMSKVHILEVNEDVELPDDLDALEQSINELGNVKAIFFDPLSAFVAAGNDLNREQDARRVLRALAAFAERTGIAIVCLRHLNKRQDLKGVYRGVGSIGITAAARAVFGVAPAKEDKDVSVFFAVKCNLSRTPKPRAWRTQLVETFDEVTGEAMKTTRIAWEDEGEFTPAEDFNADAANRTAGRPGPKPTKSRQCALLLRTLLASGPRSEQEVWTAIEQLEISKRTYAQVRKELGVEATKDGFDGGWMLHLPDRSGEVEAALNADAAAAGGVAAASV